MKISISELRRVSAQLYDHLEEKGHTTVELESDYYWIISKDDLYDPYNEPKKIYLGQLYDDYDSLKKILDKTDLEPTAYGLVWLSSIIRYVGEKIAS